MINKQTVIFKNNLPSLTRLIIHSQDDRHLHQALRKKIKQAPMMFIGMQLVIDLSPLEQEGSIHLNLSDLKRFLTAEGINPLAVICDKQATKDHALSAGFGVLPPINAVEKPRVKPTIRPAEQTTPTAPEKKTTRDEPKKTFESPRRKAPVELGNQTIKHSVRSGQRIYAKGDLTIVGAVSAGAEVIADGNIHIYGTLRGRAIAGAQGDEKCQIFCQKLDAELIAIAGNYKQLEETDEAYRDKPVQISWDNKKIRFFTL